ncbi:MAG: ABC transporter ATP-binding protein [Sulfuritalea sp.]|nr:ABC transporter ATP-binding protein [Sulfuritalea sp.]
MSAVRLESVSKHWGASHAVDRVSFETRSGQFIVLLGPSGCGKSTTLRLIAGLETTAGGQIFIGDREVTSLPPAKRNVSMVFQSYALFPHLSVAENILFGLKVRGVNVGERQKRLTQVADLLSLGLLLDRKPSQLSGGQQQRVALGRAIIARTPVCLMDEPLSNLDAQLRSEMRSEIRALQQKLGITMIYVTHDQTEAMSMADQVILMRDGRIEQDAAPADLYLKPASVFAARFIGTPPMNVVALTNAGNAAGGAAIRGSATVIDAFPGEGRLLGIRPEDIVIGAAGVAGTVEYLDYLGADSIVKCRVGDELLLARTPGKFHGVPGDVVHLGWNPISQHFFDAASGRRIDTLDTVARAAA